jgi:hypothetical protein
MTRHFNPSITNRAARILNSKQGDFLSDEVSGPVAVIPIHAIQSLFKEGSSAATFFTSSADKDTYLCSAHLSGSKTVADTGTSLSLRVRINNEVVVLVGLTGITTTAERDSIAIMFNPPVRIDRNSAVDISQGGSWTAKRAVISGYTEEVISS